VKKETKGALGKTTKKLGQASEREEGNLEGETGQGVLQSERKEPLKEEKKKQWKQGRRRRLDEKQDRQTVLGGFPG